MSHETVATAKNRHGKHAKDTAGITFRVSRATKSALRELAAKDDRTVSDFLRVHFTRFIRKSRAASVAKKEAA